MVFGGAWRSLAARSLWEREAESSNLSAPTNLPLQPPAESVYNGASDAGVAQW